MRLCVRPSVNDSCPRITRISTNENRLIDDRKILLAEKLKQIEIFLSSNLSAVTRFDLALEP